MLTQEAKELLRKSVEEGGVFDEARVPSPHRKTIVDIFRNISEMREEEILQKLTDYKDKKISEKEEEARNVSVNAEAETERLRIEIEELRNLPL